MEFFNNLLLSRKFWTKFNPIFWTCWELEENFEQQLLTISENIVTTAVEEFQILNYKQTEQQ